MEAIRKSVDIMREMRAAEASLKEHEVSELKSFLVNLGMEKEDLSKIEYDCCILFPDIQNKEEVKSKLPFWLQKRVEFSMYQDQGKVMVLNRSSQEYKPGYKPDMKHYMRFNPPPIFNLVQP